MKLNLLAHLKQDESELMASFGPARRVQQRQNSSSSTARKPTALPRAMRPRTAYSCRTDR